MHKCKNCQAVLPDRMPNQLGRNRLFCNDFCSRLFASGKVFVDKPSNCLFCNVDLFNVGSGRPKKYCSKSHADKYLKLLKPKAPLLNKICDWCSSSFQSKMKAARFCSHDCRRLKASEKGRLETLARQAANPNRFDYNCDDCGRLVVSDKKVTVGHHGRYCNFCSLRRRRERYRIKTAKRQKVLNPIRISADVLIERDGNVCHLCNLEIDLSLARNSRFGATIDHVVPVSKGGADTLDNMKLAHWICNIKKGNKV